MLLLGCNDEMLIHEQSPRTEWMIWNRRNAKNKSGHKKTAIAQLNSTQDEAASLATRTHWAVQWE